MHVVGTTLSKIAAHEFSKSGFFDLELDVIPSESSSEVIKFAQDCLSHKTVLTVLTHELMELLLYGVKYLFSAEVNIATRGMATAHSSPLLKK